MVTFQRLCRSCLARHFLLADGGPAVLRIVQEPRSHRSVALARNLISRLVSLRDVQDAIKTSGNAGRIELRELTELIEAALLPAAALAPA